jgi:cob(I)alamin adenosyltransferase
MTKLYTAKGDGGETNLMGAKAKVPKDHLRVMALGEVDELNAAIGVAMEYVPDEVTAVLRDVQNALFTVGAELSAAGGKAKAQKLPSVTEDRVRHLEVLLARFDVGEIKEFVLPRGHGGAAHLHHARAVARRAERAVVALAAKEEVGAALLAYLNRLSSLLFALAVWSFRRTGGLESHPTYPR